MKRESKRRGKKRVQGWSQEHDVIRVNKLVSRGMDRKTLFKTQQGLGSKRTERECGTGMQARAKRESCSGTDTLHSGNGKPALLLFAFHLHPWLYRPIGLGAQPGA